MKTCIVTVASGRHEHLRAQMRAIALSAELPDHHIVVAMGDPDIDAIVDAAPSPSISLWIPVTGSLPLARARNMGADAALERGAELIVFLDVDCVPHRHMLSRFRAAARDDRHSHDVLCGPVTYLPADANVASMNALDELTNPHPARPNPEDNTVLAGDRYELFWSLSFAVRSETWRRLGGFCEQYTGYGAEDTDLGQCAAAAQVGLSWVGGAHAYHQYHPVSNPPVEHLDEILCNARLFEQRWGWWPMQGWLKSFASAGLIEYHDASNSWRRITN